MTGYARFCILNLLFCLICVEANARQLNDTDLKLLRETVESYARAWLTNDADTVMAVFVDEPVLSPSGLPFIEGRQAARDFWFPADSPATTVTDFAMSILEVGGSGNLGYVRGNFLLTFEYDGANYQNRGKFVSILKKQADGAWRISHHFWDDFPRGE